MPRLRRVGRLDDGGVTPPASGRSDIRRGGRSGIWERCGRRTLALIPLATRTGGATTTFHLKASRPRSIGQATLGLGGAKGCAGPVYRCLRRRAECPRRVSGGLKMPIESNGLRSASIRWNRLRSAARFAAPLALSIAAAGAPAFAQTIPGFGSYRSTPDGGVACGSEYTGYARSADGRKVCAGGRATSYARSVDGREVACGGLFRGYARSVDGARVCAGGEFNSYARTADGSQVVCGQRYAGYARNSSGTRVCAGGEFDSYARTANGSEVVCGARFNSYARSSDGTRVCAGGEYDGYARSTDGRRVACGGRFKGRATSTDGTQSCVGGATR